MTYSGMFVIYYQYQWEVVTVKNDRLFQLVYLLLEKGMVSAPQLAEKLGVSVRTIYRDVDALSEAGVPVYAANGRGGGIALMPGYTFSKALLSDEEQSELLTAIHAVRAAGSHSDTLLTKLGGLFQKQAVNWIEVDFSRWDPVKPEQPYFEIMKTAILEKHLLSILYCNMAGEIAKRHVKPVKLIFKDKSWYLQAYCLKAEAYRLFKISRIVELKMEPQIFSDCFLDAPAIQFTMDENVPTVQAELLFQKEIAYRAYDEFEHSHIRKQADGTLLISAVLPLEKWVAEYLLSYGEGITVLSPESLRKELGNLAKKIGERYQT